MTRPAAAGDFQIEVPKIGQFTFGRRTTRDVYRIRGEYNRMTGGSYDADGHYADFSALAFCTLQVLMVQAPDGFDLEKIDPIVDEEWEDRVLKVWTVLREKELSFRPSSGEAGKAAGA